MLSTMLPAVTTAASFTTTACSFFGNRFALAGCNRFTTFKRLLLSFFAYSTGAAIYAIFTTAAIAACFTIFTAGTFGKSSGIISTATICACCKTVQGVQKRNTKNKGFHAAMGLSNAGVFVR